MQPTPEPEVDPDVEPGAEPDTDIGTARRRWRWVVPALAVLVLAAGLGWAFQPWTLFTNRQVTEAMPGQLTTVRTSASPQAAATPAAAPSPSPVPASTVPRAQQSPECTCDALPKAGPSKGPDGAGRLTLRTGFFVGQGHPTTGTVSVIQLPDGRRFLRLQDLSTRNGPALRVWLSEQPVRATQDSWAGYGDAAHRDLGALKGNLGSQNYEIPADVDLDAIVSVTIWSTRYSVSYGAASLQR